MSTVTLPAPQTDAEYFDAPGLSQSGMKDIAISPLRFWYRHVRPGRVDEPPTPEMQFGSALHCAILEPSEFDKRYACELVPPEGCLDTMDELRGWLRDQGLTPKGTRKADVIAQVRAHLNAPPILDVLQSQHAKDHAGKVLFKADDWQRIQGAAEALRSEPRLTEIMKDGCPEVPMFATDPETGVLLKAKMDFVAPTLTADLKTFRTKRDKPMGVAITDTIWYERYHIQSYFYSYVRSLQTGKFHLPLDRAQFVFAFVEAEPPHETRIRVIRPKTARTLWQRAEIETHGMIRLYAEYLEHFGTDKPWRYACDVDEVVDEEIRGLYL